MFLPVTKSIEQRPSSEEDSLSAGREIPRLLWHPKLLVFTRVSLWSPSVMRNFTERYITSLNIITYVLLESQLFDRYYKKYWFGIELPIDQNSIRRVHEYWHAWADTARSICIFRFLANLCITNNADVNPPICSIRTHCIKVLLLILFTKRQINNLRAVTCTVATTAYVTAQDLTRQKDL
jgi:hypothetical protein